MTEDTADVQQAIAASSTPAAEFAQLSRRRQVEVFFSLPQTVQQSLLADMDVGQVRRFVRRLDPDEGADVLGLADEETRTEVLRRLDQDRSDALSYLLEFDPETAAGLMHIDYVTVDVERSLADAARRVERFEARNDVVPIIFVVDDEEFVGELPGRALAMADDGSERLRDHVEKTPVVTYDTPDTEVVEVFRRAPERSVAVLDDDGTILGVIYAGDLLRVVEEEASETLYEFTGVQEEESILDGPLKKVRYRYKWLIINLGTAFLAAAAVGVFEETIAAFTLLAVYMPVVAGMGGNAGTQSMAVTVRGIALGQISLSSGSRAVGNEVVAGAANGFITGVLVAVIATVFNQSPLLGLVLGVSMVLNLVIAGFFGTAIPLVLDRIGKDPATSATIFITTATDVLGFFIFLGLARSVL
ncbi:MgtE integral membrane protein [Halogeometricum pallidum JCM 14848]|uniref:MgtE integral membrane protein n=1 Tax=Halogeometricum pallidum JCM 14848 TaxID=1227487 RepID=M0CVW2_HALPD|nr:magnesium transporter [Halogeometricum pallidum]ELZ26557.1 MgtE integral membrane protein [Halogeometricum pallidum JCM 14848]